MALIDADRILVAKEWRDLVHGLLGLSAKWTALDIKAAVDAADAVLDLNASALTQNQTVLQNLNAALPEPFKTQATTGQKWLLLARIAIKRSGLL
jgi:hypothetical protein